MNTFVVYDEEKDEFINLACDSVQLLEFENETEFNQFVKMHPSCFYSNKKYNPDGSITALFNVYQHKRYKPGIGHTIDFSYNSNVLHEVEKEEYYRLKSYEKQLKEELKRLEKLKKKYES